MRERVRAFNCGACSVGPKTYSNYTCSVLGALVTFLFAIGAACFGHLLISRLTASLDPALRIGVSGLAGLGGIGTLTLFVGLVPGGLSIIGMTLLWLVVVASAALCLREGRPQVRFILPKDLSLLALLAIALALIIALVSVLAPSDILEWDTLAYHLAVPKIWLHDGQIHPISFIHHSNFPLAVDNLYIWGLSWGGESGAKAFTLAFHIYGILAIFGLARQVYGEVAAWWAAVAWATIPAVLWLSGTGYIDVQNGLYAGLGILFAALLARDRAAEYGWLSGVMLGLAAGSKYTGLQTIFAAAVVLIAAPLVTNRKSKTENRKSKIENPKSFLVPLIALAIASPWYFKNVVWMGNPVYPFFYNQFGGKYWSPWQGQIYQAEQQSFGVARESPPSSPIQPQRIGHAVLGLAYQPGRYINPGETSGQGTPLGATGLVAIGALLLWMMSGRASPFESSALAIILVSFGMWFVLSEQSRYIIALGVPLSVLAGGAVVRLRSGRFLAAAIAIQALVSFYVVKSLRFDDEIRVVTGQTSLDDYMKHTAFYAISKTLNEDVKGGRVALFDEVFGFFLDVPYLWANPGHSNELGYDKMATAGDLVSALKRDGVTHVYVNLIPPGSDPSDPELRRWLVTLGLDGLPQPYSPEERAKKMPDLNWRQKILLGEAIASNKLEIVERFGSTKLLLRLPE